MWSLISTSCQLLLQSESKFVYVWNARLCDTTVFCHRFDGNLYIFELQRLGLTCKELALLICSLTVVYPGLIPSHTCTRIPAWIPVCQCFLQYFFFFIIWIVILLSEWYCCKAHRWKFDVSVSWSKIMTWNQAFSKIHLMTFSSFFWIVPFLPHKDCVFFLFDINLYKFKTINTRYPYPDCFYFEKISLVPNVSMQ